MSFRVAQRGVKESGDDSNKALLKKDLSDNMKDWSNGSILEDRRSRPKSGGSIGSENGAVNIQAMGRSTTEGDSPVQSAEALNDSSSANPASSDTFADPEVGGPENTASSSVSLASSAAAAQPGAYPIAYFSSPPTSDPTSPGTTDSSSDRPERAFALSSPVVATAVSDDEGDIVTAEAVERESFFQNKNRTRLLVAVMLLMLCGLAIGLGISLSGNDNPTAKAAPSEEEHVIQQVIEPIDGDIDSEFGSSVSICRDGSRVAVAGPGTGIVQVFDVEDRSEGQQVVQQLGQNITHRQTTGWSKYVRTELVVELSDDCKVLAIGEPYAVVGGDQTGRVSLYQYDEVESKTWIPLGFPNTISGEEEDGDLTGASVSLSHDGGQVAVGSPGTRESGAYTGRVSVYQLNGRNWVRLGASLNGTFAYEAFGGSVSLSSKNNVDVVAVGMSTGTGENMATVKVFEFQRGEWNFRGSEILADMDTLMGVETSWTVHLSLDGWKLAVSNQYLDEDGVSITSDNQALLVQSFQFDRDGGTNTWVQVGTDIHRNVEGSKSGYTISLSEDGKRIAMGDPGTERQGRGLSGHSHFYELNGDKWCQLGPDVEGDAAGDLAGFAIALSADGQRMVVGSPLSRALGRTHGRVRVYSIELDEGFRANCDV